MEYLIDKIFDLLNNIIKKYNIYQYSFDNLNISEENQYIYFLINKNNTNKQDFFLKELNKIINIIKNDLKHKDIKMYFYEYFYYELYLNNILSNIINKFVNINFIINCNVEIFHETLNCKLIIYPIDNNQQYYIIEKYISNKCIFKEKYYLYITIKDCLRQIYEIIDLIS